MTNFNKSGGNQSNVWIEKLYGELHSMATRYMRDESKTVSLSPTVLIHELYLRFPKVGEEELSRTHFFALAARTMRRALVDEARHRKRQKRGGAMRRDMSVDMDAISPADSEHVLAVDEALADLEQLDNRQAQIVEMRFFGGMTMAEIAEHLAVSKRTVEGDWTMAKAWLRRWFDASTNNSSH